MKYAHLSFCKQNFSAIVLSGNILLNRSASPSHEPNEQEDTTIFRHHEISVSVAASGTTNLSKAFEQVDVEDAPGDSTDPLDTGVNVIAILNV